MIDHLLHAALAQCHELRDDAEVVLGDVDVETLDRLVQLAVDHARHNLRLADRELIAFALHHFYENRELKFASTLHLPRIGALGGKHANGDVADEFGLQPGLDLVCRELGATAATSERRRVDAYGHRD